MFAAALHLLAAWLKQTEEMLKILTNPRTGIAAMTAEATGLAGAVSRLPAAYGAYWTNAAASSVERMGAIVDRASKQTIGNEQLQVRA